MILQNNRDFDTLFVSKAIAEHKLEPNPTTGFHSENTYWQETDRWRRVIERYPWGAVLFINDRTRNAAATIVAIGKLDIENGKVSEVGGWSDINPSWYKEMAMELKTAAKSQNMLAIPKCLGFRQPDHICDGGVNPTSKKMEPACAWRDRCMALQEFAVDQSRYQEDLLRGKSPEQIVQLTTRLLQRSKTITSSQPKKPAHKQLASEKQPPVVLAPQAQSSGANKIALSTIEELAKELASEAGIQISADGTRVTAKLGELFLVDRTTNSDYISLYMAARPKPIALASFRLRSRTGLLVQLPIPKDSRMFNGIDQADVKSWSDGAFLSAVREVPLKGERIGHVKKIILSILQQPRD